MTLNQKLEEALKIGRSSAYGMLGDEEAIAMLKEWFASLTDDEKRQLLGLKEGQWLG